MTEEEIELLAKAAREVTADTEDTEEKDVVVELDNFRDFVGGPDELL